MKKNSNEAMCLYMNDLGSFLGMSQADGNTGLARQACRVKAASSVTGQRWKQRGTTVSTRALGHLCASNTALRWQPGADFNCFEVASLASEHQSNPRPPNRVESVRAASSPPRQATELEASDLRTSTPRADAAGHHVCPRLSAMAPVVATSGAARKLLLFTVPIFVTTGSVTYD